MSDSDIVVGLHFVRPRRLAVAAQSRKAGLELQPWRLVLNDSTDMVTFRLVRESACGTLRFDSWWGRRRE